MAKIFYLTNGIVVLGAEVNPEMPRNRSKADPDRNVPIPHHNKFGSDQPTMMVDRYRIITRTVRLIGQQVDELTEKMGVTNQRFPSLKHKARQSRLATEADVEPGTKTHKSTEDAAADGAMNRDSSSARVNDDPTSSTSFRMIADPITFPIFMDDALVDKGAEALKPCVVPMRMRTPTVAGGLPPAGTASTAMTTIFPRPLLFLSLREATKEKNGRMNFNQLAPPS